MRSEADWAEEPKRLLRAEMVKRGLTYDGLADRLAELGVIESTVNLRNKVARGKFTATFLLQCLTAMGARSLRLSEPENGQ